VTARERPIFVIGAPRSGTTLLRVMLAGNPRIYIPPESDFIPKLFLGRPRTPMTPQRARKAIETIVAEYKRFFREWRTEPLDPDAFVDQLPDLTPATFLNSLYSAYAALYGATRWGDKSPIYTHHVPLLAEIFPDAQFVHLIRDGRDAALSTLATYPDRFYVDLYFAARSWRSRVTASRAAGAVLGDARYLEIRYEDLTGDPERVLIEVCEFLGEMYDPAMRESHKLGRELLRAEKRHAPVLEPVHANSDRWRREMGIADQRLFQAVAGDLLHELRYEVMDLNHMSPRERGHLARLSTKYHVLEGGRRALQAVGIFAPH
jgi:hypothetical protein